MHNNKHFQTKTPLIQPIEKKIPKLHDNKVCYTRARHKIFHEALMQLCLIYAFYAPLRLMIDIKQFPPLLARRGKYCCITNATFSFSSDGCDDNTGMTGFFPIPTERRF
jgi:hypothetical protein